MATSTNASTNPRGSGRGRSKYTDMDSQGGILAALDCHVNTSDKNGATRKLSATNKGGGPKQKQATRKPQLPRRSIATSPTLDDSRKKAGSAPPTSVIFSTDADSDDDDDDDDDDASESSMSVLSSSMSIPCPLASTSAVTAATNSPALPVTAKTQPLRRNIMYPRKRGERDDDDDDSDEDESDDMSNEDDHDEDEEDSHDEQVNELQHAVDKHNKRSNVFSEDEEEEDDESEEEEEELSTASSEEEEEEEVLSEEEYDPESDDEATLTDDEELVEEGAALDEEDEEIKRKLKKPDKTLKIKASEKDMDTADDNDEVQAIESPTKDTESSLGKERNDTLDIHTNTDTYKSVEENVSLLDDSCDVVAEVFVCDDDDDDDDDVLAATVYYDDAASGAQAPSNDDTVENVLSESEAEADENEEESEEDEESYEGNGDGTAAFWSDGEADEKEACLNETESIKKVDSPKSTKQRKQDESNTAILCEKENVVVKKPATVLENMHTPPRQQRGRPRQRRSRREGNIKRGKWSLGSKIGSGAFGVVHIGMNTATGALMAVKSIKMDRAVMKDVRREIDLLRSLKHTNIVRYHGAEMYKTHLHIFQEWVAGGSVTGMLAKFGPFSLDVLRSYLSQTLDGLAYLHENDIMHRDIKGSNILVSDEGIVKLADFGASKRLENAQKDMMQSLTMRGTPYFMAVEVFEEKYSMKADVWSVGCVAIQMATGSPPWKSLGYSNPVALFSHLKSHNDPPPIEIASKDMHPLEFGLLKSVVAKCFKRDPSERPSAKSLKHDPFFSEVHTLSDDDHSVGRGLFSPESHCSWEAMHSPIATKLSPIRCRSSRSNSVGPRQSPFMSPPLPKRTGAGLRASPAPFSPPPETNEWPTWAREKHESSTAAAAAAAPTAQSLAKLGKADALTGKMIDLMGSLALSDDSCMASPAFCGNNRESSVFRRSSTVQSPLEGLQFAGYNSSLGGASPTGN